MLRLLAIGFIWFGCAVAWMILGGTLVSRTGEVSNALDSQVHSLFGPPGKQLSPSGFYEEPEHPSSSAVTKQPILLDGSVIDVAFDLEHRKKGLLWFPTYGVRFDARYTFKSPSDKPEKVTLSFPLGSETSSRVSLDDFRVTDPEGVPLPYRIDNGEATWEVEFMGREQREYRVGYRTRGTSNWQYLPTRGTGEVKNFTLRMQTSFRDVNFPAGTVSPTEHGVTSTGWRGTWQYLSLISGAPIGIEMPQLLNPGPLASKVTFFAPLSLLFFFFVVSILAVVKKREMHPMHYLMLGCAFFAFHLLFAYLVDRLALWMCFSLASVVSVFLVVSYARLFVGWRFALFGLGLSQLIYLVLFSLTFFWEGFTGLAVTIGAIITLFAVMQLTGKVNWALVFDRARERPGLDPARLPHPA